MKNSDSFAKGTDSFARDVDSFVKGADSLLGDSVRGIPFERVVILHGYGARPQTTGFLG